MLAPSLYRIKYKFEPFECLIIDECESFFEDLYSGLCRNGNFELGLDALVLLLTSTPKIIFMDGHLKNSSVTIAANFASSLDDIRLVIATYRIERGSLWELPPPLK